jgi:hypothetical protein
MVDGALRFLLQPQIKLVSLAQKKKRERENKLVHKIHTKRNHSFLQTLHYFNATIRVKKEK